MAEEETRTEDLETSEESTETSDTNTEVKETDTSDDDKVDRSELDKVIEQRQALKRKLKSMEDQLSKTEVNAQKVDKLESQLKELSKIKKEYDALLKEKEEKELAKKSEAERETIAVRKEYESFKDEMESKFSKFDSTLEEKEKEVEGLREKLVGMRKVGLESEIRAAAARYNAVNPDQIVRMLKPDFTYDDHYEAFQYQIYHNGKLKDSIDVDEHVKNFLTNEDNSNLVKASVKSGTDTKSSTKDKSTGPESFGATGETELSKDELREKLEQWAEEKEMDIEFAVKMHRKHGDKIFNK